MKNFPRPDLPIKEKFKKDTNGVFIYAKDCIDFAIEQHYMSRKAHVRKMSRLYRRYNGDYPGYAMEYLNKTYGTQNVAKYVDYRLGRPKIEKLVGEFLERPLNTTVMTVNKTAQMKKLDTYYSMLGMAAAKPQIEQLREKYGNDVVMDGMPIPDNKQLEGYWTSLSSKSKNEITMQYLVNNFTKVNRDFKLQLSENYRDVIIVAESHGKVFINHRGKVDYLEIDPRDALFLENDRDPYCKMSPYHGARRRMFFHQIVTEFGLTETEADTLFAEGHVSENALDDNYSRRAISEGAEPQTYDVYELQWMSLQPFITKYTLERNKNPLVEEPYQKDISIDYYLKNADQIEKDVAAGKYKIEFKYKEILWEGVRIGKSLYKNCGPKKNIMGSMDSPFETKYEYVHFLCGTVNGVRVSIKELLDQVEEQYNIVRFQINRELTKMKGTAFTYDRAFLPKGMTMKKVLHQIINDGLLDYSSAEDGNISGETKDPKDAFKTIDLGASTALPVLVQLAQNLENLAEVVSGVSDQRLGDIKASETSGNANAAINNSKTVTEPINYGFDVFTEEVIVRVMELMKVASLINPDWAETVVGEEGKQFIQASQNLSTDDYGCFLVNIRREKEIRDRAMAFAEQAINSGEMRVHDLMKADLEETLTGALAVLEKGWADIQSIAQEQRAADAEQAQKDRDHAIELSREDREDRQAADIEKIVVKGEIDKGLETQKSANKNLIEKNKGQLKNK